MRHVAERAGPRLVELVATAPDNCWRVWEVRRVLQHCPNIERIEVDLAVADETSGADPGTWQERLLEVLSAPAVVVRRLNVDSNAQVPMRDLAAVLTQWAATTGQELAQAAELDASWCTVGDTGAWDLADAYAAGFHARRITLCKAEAGPGAAEALAGGPARNATVIKLKDGNLQSQGLEFLANALARGDAPRLRWLDVSDNKVTAPDALAAVSRALTSPLCTLRRLDLSVNAIVDEGAEALAAGLREPGPLKILWIGFCGIGPRGAKAIADALMVEGGQGAGLTHMDVQCNKLGVEGSLAMAEALGSHKSLERVNMACNAVGGISFSPQKPAVKALMAAMEGNTTMVALKLNGNAIHTSCAAYIADLLLENETLTELDIGANVLGDDGVWEVCDALTVNQAIRWISLERNGVTRKGAAHVAELLEQNELIEYVDLRANVIDGAGEHTLAPHKSRANYTFQQTALIEAEERKRKQAEAKKAAKAKKDAEKEAAKAAKAAKKAAFAATRG